MLLDASLVCDLPLRATVDTGEPDHFTGIAALKHTIEIAIYYHIAVNIPYQATSSSYSFSVWSIHTASASTTGPARWLCRSSLGSVRH
jgi:hypothetical protein